MCWVISILYDDRSKRGISDNGCNPVKPFKGALLSFPMLGGKTEGIGARNRGPIDGSAGDCMKFLSSSAVMQSMAVIKVPSICSINFQGITGQCVANETVP